MQFKLNHDDNIWLEALRGKVSQGHNEKEAIA